MKGHIDRGSAAYEAFSAAYNLKPRDIGRCAFLKKRGMQFATQAWSVGDVGHLCVMRMSAPLGIMEMETAIFSPRSVDAPLFNIDWVGAFGGETQIAELYDVQLSPWPDDAAAVFMALHDTARDIPDMPREARWYDEVLYPCSIAKRDKKLAWRLDELAVGYLDAYVAYLYGLAPCDAQAKEEKVRAFAERLFSEGGTAVSQITKLFGEDVAYELVVEVMYGLGGR